VVKFHGSDTVPAKAETPPAAVTAPAPAQTK
jgi:hypothetical protein